MYSTRELLSINFYKGSDNVPFLKRRDPPFAAVARLLRGYGLDAAKLAPVLGCSYNTARARLRDPGTLTLAELAAINRVGHIPVEEIKNSIHVGGKK